MSGDDHAVPDVEDLRRAVAAFGGSGELPPLDPALPGDRRRLLYLLNAWGCRIPYPHEGERDVFGESVGEWARRWAADLPAGTSLATLTDAELEVVGACFGELSALSVGRPGRPRSLGSTAASKALHMLRPRMLMPWDEAIARRLHGGRDPASFVAHQRLGRTWARALLEKTGLDEGALVAKLGSPGRPLPKVLDDYCYLRFTRSEFG